LQKQLVKLKGKVENNQTGELAKYFKEQMCLLWSKTLAHHFGAVQLRSFEPCRLASGLKKISFPTVTI